MNMAAISAWAERRPARTERERSRIACEAAGHLPTIDVHKPIQISDEDLRAAKTAFIRRSDEDLPRTETLMAVLGIGYRMALRDTGAGQA